MEPIDSNLIPLSQKQIPSTSTNSHFIALLFANGLDRFAYYGFRSIIILALIDIYSIPERSIFAYYGTATTIMYCLYPIGGVLGDFVLKPRGALIAGFAICTAGAVFTLFPQLHFILIGIVLMILGSGIVRPNVLSQTNHIFAHDPDLLDRKYLMLFMATNIGAFLSIIIMAYITTQYGWIFGFIATGISYAIATLILVLTKSSKSIPDTQRTTPSPSRTYLSLLIIIPLVLFSGVYWGVYELSYSAFMDAEINFNKKMTGTIISSLGGSSMVNFVVLIIGSVIMYFLINKRSKSTHVRLLVSGLFYSSLWLLAGISNDFLGASNVGVYITFLALLAISELITLHATYSILGKVIPLKLMGTVSGVVLLLISMSVKLISYFQSYEPPSSFYFFVFAAICAFSTLLFFFLIPIFSPKKAEEIEPF